MKAYGRVVVYNHVFLTLALVGGEWSASRPSPFTPGERAPCTHCIGRWVGPRTGLDDVEPEMRKATPKFVETLGNNQHAIQPNPGR
jgi:hypothetical protein